MEILNISAALYALGWAILHSFWQMGLIWLAWQLIFGLPKKWSPAVKHNSSLIMLFSGFAWFLGTAFTHFKEYLQVKQYADLLPTADPLSGHQMSATLAGTDFTSIINAYTESVILFLEHHIGNISAVYLFILVLMMFRFTYAYIYSNQLKKKGIISAGQHFESKISEWSSAMGIRQHVYIFLSQRIDIPATIGFFKPVILLPVATVNQLSMEQVESIILHELAHIRRMDYLWNLTAAIIETILFFNPFVYLLTAVQKKERELCCDDFVLAFHRDPHNYASALLELEKNRLAGKAQLALASNGEKGQLLNRVKRILNIQNNKLQYRQRFLAIIFISTLLTALAWLQPVEWKKEKQVEAAAAPAPQWMMEVPKVPIPTLSDLVKEQVQFEKKNSASAKKRNLIKKVIPVLIEATEKEPIPPPPPPPPPAQPSPFDRRAPLHEWNFNFEELVRSEQPVFFNQPPQGWQEQIMALDQLKKGQDAAMLIQENILKEMRTSAIAKNFEKQREIVLMDKSKPRVIQKKRSPSMIFINDEPVDHKVVLDAEKNYTIRIETGENSIEIKIGSDTLTRRVTKSPKAPSRMTTTTHSSGTYPRSRY